MQRECYLIPQMNIVSVISQDEMPRRGQQRVLVQGQVCRGGGGRHQVTHYLHIYNIYRTLSTLSIKEYFHYLHTCRWQDYNPHLAARFMGEATIQDNWEGYNGADLTKSVSSVVTDDDHYHVSCAPLDTCRVWGTSSWPWCTGWRTPRWPSASPGASPAPSSPGACSSRRWSVDSI